MLDFFFAPFLLAFLKYLKDSLIFLKKVYNNNGYFLVFCKFC